MFLDPNKYLLTMKEKETHVKRGGKSQSDLFQIALLNYADIKSINDTTKAIFKDKKSVTEIANSVIMIKSFDMEVTYICYWTYEDLKNKIQDLLGEDGTLDKYFNIYIGCKRIAIDTNVILDSNEFLDMFASKLKEVFIEDIANYDKK